MSDKTPNTRVTWRTEWRCRPVRSKISVIGRVSVYLAGTKRSFLGEQVNYCQRCGWPVLSVALSQMSDGLSACRLPARGVQSIGRGAKEGRYNQNDPISDRVQEKKRRFPTRHSNIGTKLRGLLVAIVYIPRESERDRETRIERDEAGRRVAISSRLVALGHRVVGWRLMILQTTRELDSGGERERPEESEGKRGRRTE